MLSRSELVINEQALADGFGINVTDAVAEVERALATNCDPDEDADMAPPDLYPSVRDWGPGGFTPDAEMRVPTMAEAIEGLASPRLLEHLEAARRAGL